MRRAANAVGRRGIKVGLAGLVLGLALGGCSEAPSDATDMAKQELRRTQPGWKLVRVADLAADDATTWNSEREGVEPGFCAGDFFGDGRPAFAALLHQMGPQGKRARLVILGQEPSGRFVSFPVFTVSPIERVPAIWKANAGEYEVYLNEQMMRVTMEGVVYNHTGLGKKLFFWNDGRFVDIELGGQP